MNSLTVSMPIPSSGRDRSGNQKAKPPLWLDALRAVNDETWERLICHGEQPRQNLSGRATYVLEDAVKWLGEAPENSVHAIVTDPPYGVIEYDEKNHAKLKAGRGGVWRIPPSWDGAKRQPLPRFTVLTKGEIDALYDFFTTVALGAMRMLVPGGHVFIASNPLLSSMTFHAFQEAGFEKRAEVIRLVQTLRGGDRPKGSERDFPDVSVMPRSSWEPWGVFRKPFSGTVASNLRQWGTGGLRRISDSEPFRDVISCSPTRGKEREIAPHPSLKPQRFMRQIVRASLPLGEGIVYDPFAGSASTLAAAEAVGYRAIGTERNREYFDLGCSAFPDLSTLKLTTE